MASVFLLVTRQARQNAFVREIQRAGHRVVTAEPRHPDYRLGIEAMRPRPDVILVEGTMFPHLARQAVADLKDSKAYRDVPVVFYNATPEDEAAARAKVPDARFVDAAGVLGLLTAASAPP